MNDEDNVKNIPLNQILTDEYYKKYEKLLKRIRAVLPIPETIEGIMSIDLYTFSEIRGIGKKYITHLKELKKELSTLLENEESLVLLRNIESSENTDSRMKKVEIYIEPEDMKIPLSNVPLLYKYQKLLNKIRYSDELRFEETVGGIMHLTSDSLKLVKGLGVRYITLLNELKRELPSILEMQRNQDININIIDRTLVEDIENYLWSLNERDMDIALSRWGYNEQYKTLEEIGNKWNLTREGIRQIESKIQRNLSTSLRIHPQVLWKNINENMTSNLAELLPNLAQCFDTSERFYSFIEMCCEVKKGSIQKVMIPDFNRNILNSFFCKTASPVSKELIVEELMLNFDFSEVAAENVIRKLAKIGMIRISEQGIIPQNMDKKSGVAHVLTHYPNGLPWRDIAQIVNIHNYSKDKLSENAIEQHTFGNSEIIYLCAKGTYRHLMFLDLNQIDIEDIILNVLFYFDKCKTESINLYDYFYKNKENIQNIEYFTLRHIIKAFGAEHGLFFDGRANVDSVSLESESTRFTQSQLVVQTLQQASGAMTMQEIAKILRSRSINHAHYYVNRLQKEGKIVRVDNMMYTTPEKAFGNIDRTAVIEIIKDIMKLSDNRIVESDVFREGINRELNLSYSKYFYASFAKLHIKSNGWYKYKNFFSTIPIQFKSLDEIFKLQCRSSLSNEKNISKVNELIWLTDSLAKYALYRWKQNLIIENKD